MRISADEAVNLRREHMRRGAGGVEQMMKLAQAPSTWNAAARSARFTMTSQSVDRYGDVVVTSGLDTTEFERNPVAFLNHDSRSWPIGTWKNVEKVLRGRPPRMEGDLVLHKSGGPVPEVDQAAWMIENGYMRACSIGFIPDWESIEKVTDDNGNWTGGLMFNQAEIVECSLCGVPANPEALAKSIEGNVAFAHEAIEDVLDNWARDPDGKLIERTTFEDLYQLTGKNEDIRAAVESRLAAIDKDAALAICEKYVVAAGKVVASKEWHDAAKRAAWNKRMTDKRRRELEMLRQRGR